MIMTRSFKALLAFAGVAVALIVWRFAAGLGATTAMSDGYPWGIWIAFDVVTGTALACGGYAVAILVYVFNKGKYHPLIRPAILTSLLGYSVAGFSVLLDLGRPWNVWKVPTFITSWNLSSALLEVALCIMAYNVVLIIELTPALLEKWPHSKISKKLLPFFDKALIWIAALGILLPTMHQSSLGSLMLLTGPKLHPLWNTPFLPFFFLVTCLAMGYAAVVFESSFSSMAFHRKPETPLLAQLQRVAAWGMLIFVVLRFLDLARTGKLALIAQLDLYGIMFWIETALFCAPLFIAGKNLGSLFRSAMVLMFAGGLYRFDTFLVAYDPGPGWHYFPSVPEMFITLGLIAIELAIYVAIVKTFPILSGRAQEAM
jgi:Ni/Fe-hydrogenase subunit HybB-like protein